ncbi:MAG: hypothetical protein HYY43_00700 [Deltaproteobacteria bacterium]|nr:hypothetical protein [Deltaproteobacteria bacterium]
MTAKCSIEGCKKPYRSKGYCSIHFKKWRAGEIEGHKTRYKTCKEENCRKPLFKKGLCEQHFGALVASKKGQEAAAAAPAEAPAPAEAAPVAPTAAS